MSFSIEVQNEPEKVMSGTIWKSLCQNWHFEMALKNLYCLISFYNIEILYSRQCFTYLFLIL